MAQFPGYIYHKNAWLYCENEIKSNMGRSPDIIENDGNLIGEIRNFENASLSEYSNILDLLDEFKVYSIVIHRNLNNWLASQLKKFEDENLLEHMEECITAYDDIHKEITNETNFILNKLCINFDMWFSQKQYREQIAHNLDIPFTDAGINVLGRPGKGSSFDGYTYTDNAQEMDVLNRYKLMEHNDIYNKYIKDPRIEKWINYTNENY